MPKKPKRPCSYPGCPELTDGRYCEPHQRLADQQYEKYDRDPATRKRYGRTWKRIRDRYIAAHPLCEQCNKTGRLTPADEVHHITPLSKEAVQDDFDIDKEKAEVEKKGSITQHGDIWILGNHRLMCGDSTSAEDFARLMDGSHAQMAITSPPYGVGKEYEKAGIEPWFETMKPAIRNICKHADIVCWQMIDLYCTGSQFIEPTGFYSVQMFADSGYRPIWIRIWKKQGTPFGAAPYHLVSNKPAAQYEYVTAFAGKETEEYNEQEYVWLSAFSGHSYKFVKRLTKEERKKWGYAGVWEITTVRAHKDHPAMFPVELPWRCIKMHSDRDGIVLEPFSGSGTTIIAAEQTERRCYAMELSPIYCDVAVRRWEEFTGEKAVRMEAGL